MLTVDSHYDYIDRHKLIYLALNHMSTLTFDTLKFANKLKSAGVPEKQAEAEAEALSEALEVNLKDLVTKEYLDTKFQKELAPILTDLAVLKADSITLKWMMGILIAGVMSIVIKTFFS